MTAWLSDLRSAARTLRATPPFTWLAVVILALGIGANTMLFSVADAVLFRSLPFADQSRLIIAGEDQIAPRSEISHLDFRFWRANTGSLEDLAVIGSSNWTWFVRTQGELAPVRYRAVSWNFFDVLGARPLAGRTFQPDDDRRGAARTVVISYGFWQRQFGGDPRIVGQSIVVSDHACTIVGVMPPQFRYPAGADLWTPIVPDLAAVAASVAIERLEESDVGVLFAIGRMKRGVTVDAVRADLTRMIAQRAKVVGRTRHVEARVAPLVDDLLGTARPAIWLLLAAVAVLLLVACTNVAGLMLVRASRRSREFAIRLALGASRIALARQVACETLLLTIAAAIAAAMASRVALPLVVAMIPGDVPRISDAAIDPRALAFTAVVSLAVTILSAAAPAWRVARGDLEPVLRSGGQVAASQSRQPLRRALVIGELAAAIVLMTAAGLLLRSVVRLARLDLGFNQHQLFVVTPTLSSPPIGERGIRDFMDRAAAAVAGVPGVTAVGAASFRPLLGPIGLDSPIRLDGQSAEAAAQNPFVNTNTITPAYFRTMQARLVRGRPFDRRDGPDAQPVVVVNERLAKWAWPGQDAVGRRLQIVALNGARSPGPVWWTVIAVVADMRSREIHSPSFDVYAPAAQSTDHVNEIMVRAAGPSVIPLIRRRLQAMNGNGVVRVEMMEDVVAAHQASWRATLTVFATFAVLTVSIAVIGLYSMLAWTVVERAREIGVRLVLGATPRRIASDVLADGVRLILAGSAVGLAAAAGMARLMRALLFEVSPLDAMTLGLVPLALSAVAILGCALPALRAANTEPAVCLRSD